VILLYPIYNLKGNYRKNTPAIIVTQVRNLFETGNVHNPDSFYSSYYYMWEVWQRYFMRTRKMLPCHFFSELVERDYAVYMGLNLRLRSYFLEDLAQEKIIPYNFKDSILIAMKIDFTIEPPEDRMYYHIADKLISWAMYQFKLESKDIYYLDELLVGNWQTLLEASRLRYDIRPSRYINMYDFKQVIKRYEK
jgi:hypothetical protein